MTCLGLAFTRVPAQTPGVQQGICFKNGTATRLSGVMVKNKRTNTKNMYPTFTERSVYRPKQAIPFYSALAITGMKVLQWLSLKRL